VHYLPIFEGPRRDWPSCRAAEQRDELATLQFMKLHPMSAGQQRIG
jgi:hypothetical protein